MDEVPSKSAPRTNKPKFVPYATMFKFEGPPRPGFDIDVKARQLQCVSCEEVLTWRIYTLSPEKFDSECHKCGVKARDFWKGKLHKELDKDA